MPRSEKDVRKEAYQGLVGHQEEICWDLGAVG